MKFGNLLSDLQCESVTGGETEVSGLCSDADEIGRAHV